MILSVTAANEHGSVS